MTAETIHLCKPLILILISICMPILAEQNATPKQTITNNQIRTWIEDLDAEEFQKRTVATNELSSGGSHTLRAVQKALQSKESSVETRQALLKLVDSIEMKLAWETLTTGPPQNVSLKEVTVKQAAKILSEKFNLKLRFGGGDSTLTARPITIELKNAHWTEAMAKFFNMLGEHTFLVHRHIISRRKFSDHLNTIPEFTIGSLSLWDDRDKPKAPTPLYIAHNGLLFCARLITHYPPDDEEESSSWYIQINNLVPSTLLNSKFILADMVIVDSKGRRHPVLTGADHTGKDLLLNRELIKSCGGDVVDIEVVVKIKWPQAIRIKTIEAPFENGKIKITSRRSLSFSFRKDAGNDIFDWHEYLTFEGIQNKPILGSVRAFDKQGKPLKYIRFGGRSGSVSSTSNKRQTTHHGENWTIKERPAKIEYTYSKGFQIKSEKLTFKGLKLPTVK